MLRIRAEHLAALEVQQASGFADRMMLHLREMFAEEVFGLDDDLLRSFANRVSAIGEEWGITEEPHVERLIELFVSFSDLRSPVRPEWIHDTVTFPGRPGEQVLRMLEDGLYFGDNA